MPLNIDRIEKGFQIIDSALKSLNESLSTINSIPQAGRKVSRKGDLTNIQALRERENQSRELLRRAYKIQSLGKRLVDRLISKWEGPVPPHKIMKRIMDYDYQIKTIIMNNGALYHTGFIHPKGIISEKSRNAYLSMVLPHDNL